jgi:hypothetical protein
MTSKYSLFKERSPQCPWYFWYFNDGKPRCQGRVSYNQHVNDPRFGSCDVFDCPIFFWVTCLENPETPSVEDLL